MWPWEIAGSLTKGSVLTSVFFIVELVGHVSINPARVAAMAHMHQTIFLFIAVYNAVIFLIFSILLAILVTCFEIVKLGCLVPPPIKPG